MTRFKTVKTEYEAFRRKLIEREREHILNSADIDDARVVYGKCTEFCEAFAKEFKELRVVPGFFRGAEHRWLVNKEGEIYDPTVEQFDVEPLAEYYREFNPETDRIRLGKCMNCGWEIYGLISEGGKCICSPECAKAMENA